LKAKSEEVEGAEEEKRVKPEEVSEGVAPLSLPLSPPKSDPKGVGDEKSMLNGPGVEPPLRLKLSGAAPESVLLADTDENERGPANDEKLEKPLSPDAVGTNASLAALLCSSSPDF
jgi:hypothetical protein